MKKTLVTLLVLAGAAGAETWTHDLTALSPANTLIGGASNTAAVTTEAFDNTTQFDSLTTLIVNSDTWYASHGYNNNVGTGHVSANADGTVLVAGGPDGSGRSTIGGIKFSLTSTQLSKVDGPLTFSFDIARHAGNNNSNHQITFYLRTDTTTLTSLTYNSKTGDNLLKADSTTTPVKLSFTAEEVKAMQATGVDQTFVFVAYTDAVNGSNTGVLMKNFQMSGKLAPEPATATLSLLALCGLAVRRRRK